MHWSYDSQTGLQKQPFLKQFLKNTLWTSKCSNCQAAVDFLMVYTMNHPEICSNRPTITSNKTENSKKSKLFLDSQECWNADFHN
jgi:hypothetical protein